MCSASATYTAPFITTTTTTFKSTSTVNLLHTTTTTVATSNSMPPTINTSHHVVNTDATSTNTIRNDPSSSSNPPSTGLSDAQITAIYIITATVAMLLCLLLAACHQRRRRTARAAAALHLSGFYHHGRITANATPRVPPAAAGGRRVGSGCIRGGKAVTTVISDQARLTGADCPICLDSLNDGTCVRAGICNHPVHEGCLSQWLAQDKKTSCPVCRATFFLLPEGVCDTQKHGEHPNSHTTADTLVDMQAAQSSVISETSTQNYSNGAERENADATVSVSSATETMTTVAINGHRADGLGAPIPPGEVLDVVDIFDSPANSTAPPSEGSSQHSVRTCADIDDWNGDSSSDSHYDSDRVSESND